MTNENKKFIKIVSALAFPIFIQDMLNAMVNLLDSFMVGRLGLDAINAVGFANQLYFLYSLLLFGSCSGSAILIGQFWGKGDGKNIHKAMGANVSVGLVAALIFTVIAVVFPGWFLSLYTDNAEVIRQGTTYLRTVAPCYFILPLIMAVNAALKSVRKTTYPMLTTIIALAVNAGLNALFIFGLKMGVFGAALATVIARVVEFAAQRLIVKRLRLPVYARVREYFRLSGSFVLNYLKVTTPVIINEFMWALGIALYSIAYKVCGDEAQGAVQISRAITDLFFIMGLSVGSASGILIANSLGAGERGRAISYSRKAMLFNIAIGGAAGLLLIITCPFLSDFYSVSDGVKALANNIMRITGLAMAIKLFNFTTIVGILRNGGDTRFCMFVDVGAVWLVGVPLAFFGAYVLRAPVYAVAAMVLCEEVVKAVISGRRVWSDKWARTIV